ncbi:MAG: hypothetical protein V3V49_01815 [Candidatus Krumholzibacteria bacterium]
MTTRTWRPLLSLRSLLCGVGTIPFLLTVVSCTQSLSQSPGQVLAKDAMWEPPALWESRTPPGSLWAQQDQAPNEESKQEVWGDDDWDDEDEEGPGRTFFYKEVVLSGLYSPAGVVGMPMNDATTDHFELTQRPPGNYIGVDYVRTFNSSSVLNKQLLPRWLPLSALDFHPRLALDRMSPDDGAGSHAMDGGCPMGAAPTPNPKQDQPARKYRASPLCGHPSPPSTRIRFAPQDFWVRFNPVRKDRLALRVGQFVIPYGVNPVLAPRQRFMLPLEAIDLGLKWDWGVDLKGPVGGYDWEFAATVGSGEVPRSPHLFENSDRGSYLITGRIGTPTYWDFQYGLSALYGDLPMIRAAARLSDMAISRWRVGLDTFHKAGTFLMAGAQVTYGQDGFSEDGMATLDVLGYRVWVDWVVPQFLDLRFASQFESIIRDLSASSSDDTALVFESNYSLTTLVSIVLDYRLEFDRSMGDENNAFFLTFVYYGR